MGGWGARGGWLAGGDDGTRAIIVGRCMAPTPRMPCDMKVTPARE
jgi:hypothetical protein